MKKGEKIKKCKNKKKISVILPTLFRVLRVPYNNNVHIASSARKDKKKLYSPCFINLALYIRELFSRRALINYKIQIIFPNPFARREKPKSKNSFFSSSLLVLSVKNYIKSWLILIFVLSKYFSWLTKL